MPKKATIRVKKRKDGELVYFDVLEMRMMPLMFFTPERARILYRETAF